MWERAFKSGVIARQWPETNLILWDSLPALDVILLRQKNYLDHSFHSRF